MDSKIMNYSIFFLLFIIGQSLVTIGSFVSLPYKNLSIWESIKMSLPFIWLDWVFLTFAVTLLHKHALLTNTQFLFTVIVFQFAAGMIMNKFYLKQTINTSDYVAFGLIIVAYIISEFHLFSKFFNLSIPKKTSSEDEKQKQEKA